MAGPEVPIDVDETTGIWTSDGLPMLYMPRHFFINNHNAVAEALGRDVYARQVYEAGFASAWSWCAHEAGVQDLSGMAVFHHYLKRLSQRGWGQFDGGAIDPQTGCGDVFVRHSCFVSGSDKGAAGRLCYLFAGWFPGALSWVRGEAADQSRFTCSETRCASEGHDFCVFTVTER